MKRPISRLGHGLTDYPYVATLRIAPKLVGFEDEPAAVLTTKVLTSAILASSVLTRAEWGFVRILPFKTHLAIDVLGGVAALAAPWLLGFSGNARARNFFLAVALTAFAVGPLSDPEEMP